MNHYVIAFVALLFGGNLVADQPLLKPNDRVALVGGTFIERMQTTGALEAELQTRRPDWKLSVRNLGWSGDDVHGVARKVFGNADQGFQRLMRDLQVADPTVVIIAYGFTEASDGDDAVDRFQPGLQKLIANLQSQQRRIVLVKPFAMPGYLIARYAELIARCRGIVDRVGADAKVPVISVNWSPDDDELTDHQLLPNDHGYATFAAKLADSLVGGEVANRPSDDIYRLIAEKNQLFFYRYRPQNETYLFLFRKHEQGNNAVEIPQFDPLIQAADEAIWKTTAQHH